MHDSSTCLLMCVCVAFVCCDHAWRASLNYCSLMGMTITAADCFNRVVECYITVANIDLFHLSHRACQTLIRR